MRDSVYPHAFWHVVLHGIAWPFVVAAIVAYGLCGCASDAAFVERMRSVYIRVAPRHQVYVEGDTALDDLERTTYLLTLETWDAVLRAKEQEVAGE